MFSGSLKRWLLSLVMMCGSTVGVWAQDDQQPQDLPAASLQRQFINLYLQAEQGDAEAQYAVGMMYYSGRQVAQDKSLAAVWFEKAARQGQRDAQYFLSLMYGLADGVAKNQGAAVRWCLAAANQGQTDAQYSLGRMYSTGQGVPQDDIQAVKWLTKAAEEGHPDAQYELGLMYQSGHGVQKNLNQAIEWWTKASEQGHTGAALLLEEAMLTSGSGSGTAESLSRQMDELLNSLAADLGLFENPERDLNQPFEGERVPKIEPILETVDSGKNTDIRKEPITVKEVPPPTVVEGTPPQEADIELAPEVAVDIPEPQIDPTVLTKDPSTSYDLAVRYYEGNGVEQDYAQAVKRFQEAAQQGHPQAQYKLGVMYSFGQGVSQNSNEAVKWFRKAAEQGLPAAQYSLGVMYATGQGVDLDPVAAAELYTQAAEHGSVAAQYMLGVIYSTGQGVARDSETAVKWYTKAAEQGSPVSQYLLAVLYEKGQGVVMPDEKEALKWYIRAAERGHAEAQYDLAVKYMTGQGVEEDFVKAYAWCLLAALNKKNVARHETWLEERMSPEQLQESRLLAREILTRMAQNESTK